MEIVIAASAIEDIREISDWYDEQADGLGKDFKDDFFSIMPYISETPKAYRVKYKGFRVVALKRFPYLVFYRIESSQIIIHAVAHAKRNKRKLKI